MSVCCRLLRLDVMSVNSNISHPWRGADIGQAHVQLLVVSRASPLLLQCYRLDTNFYILRCFVTLIRPRCHCCVFMSIMILLISMLKRICNSKWRRLGSSAAVF